jgi:hypothetical protein
MLNALIGAVVVILVILLAIKYGFLQVMAIVLAVLALIPFAISVYLYFAKAPVLSYQLASKAKKQDGGGYIYAAELLIECRKGKGLLENVYVSTDWDITPDPTWQIDYAGLFQEAGMSPTLRLSTKPSPFIFEKQTFLYPVRYRCKDDRKSVKLTVLADVAMDPYKHGLLSIFQPNYRYRFISEIAMDFENLKKQEGSLELRR